MTDATKTKRKTLKQRQYDVRALMRLRTHVTCDIVAEQFGISRIQAWRVLDSLVERGDARIAFIRGSGSRGGVTHHYELTESYLRHFAAVAGSRKNKPAPWVITYTEQAPAQPARKPWYKRAAEWLLGGGARA